MSNTFFMSRETGSFCIYPTEKTFQLWADYPLIVSGMRAKESKDVTKEHKSSCNARYIDWELKRRYYYGVRIN